MQILKCRQFRVETALLRRKAKKFPEFDTLLVCFIESYLAAVWAMKIDKCFQQYCLSAARCADNPEDFTLINLKIQRIQDILSAKIFIEIFDLKQNISFFFSPHAV